MAPQQRGRAHCRSLSHSRRRVGEVRREEAGAAKWPVTEAKDDEERAAAACRGCCVVRSLLGRISSNRTRSLNRPGGQDRAALGGSQIPSELCPVAWPSWRQWGGIKAVEPIAPLPPLVAAKARGRVRLPDGISPSQAQAAQ